MARLVTTAAEKAAKSYFNWDDASIGRAAKMFAALIQDTSKKQDGLHQITCASAAMLLVGQMVESNAAHLDLKLDDFTHNDIPEGSWRVRIDRVKQSKKRPA